MQTSLPTPVPKPAKVKANLPVYGVQSPRISPVASSTHNTFRPDIYRTSEGNVS